MNEVELLFHRVKLGESSKKTLEKLAQELLDKLQLSFWGEGCPITKFEL